MRRWFKGLRGKKASDTDVASDASDWPEAGAGRAADQPDPLRGQLERGEDELAAGDLQAAVDSSRGLLMAGSGDARVLDFAGRLMLAAEEPALAQLFLAAAADTADPMPLLEVAGALMERQDWALGLALADEAAGRSGGEPTARVLAAEALLRMGRPADALQRLDVFAADGDWPSLGVAERYGWAAVVAEDYVRLHTVRPVLLDSGECDWVLEAGDRGLRYTESQDPSRPLRDLSFERYGVLLIDEPAPSTGDLGDVGGGRMESVEPLRLGRWIAMLATVLKPRLELAGDSVRVAWISPGSEVIARWIAQTMGMSAMPLSARLPDQPVVVITADDRDVEALSATSSFFNAPSLWVQLLKHPDALDTPMPDILCMWSSAAALPFDGLTAERASERIPPKLMVSALQEQSRAVGSLTLDVFGQWVDVREDHLTLSRARRPEERALWVGGLARPPIIEAPEPVEAPTGRAADGGADHDADALGGGEGLSSLAAASAEPQ